MSSEDNPGTAAVRISWGGAMALLRGKGSPRLNVDAKIMLTVLLFADAEEAAA
ncbi:hypothetical protein [Brachybacterium alimentarium]|uniref:hypothetical protein n=1 Tax=Brachybacterium alimentarium TaxID=47845 RepID=UPI0015F00A2F|nr:hypothetical protein [Brachybacterium alimentarium]